MQAETQPLFGRESPTAKCSTWNGKQSPMKAQAKEMQILILCMLTVVLRSCCSRKFLQEVVIPADPLAQIQLRKKTKAAIQEAKGNGKNGKAKAKAKAKGKASKGKVSSAAGKSSPKKAGKGTKQERQLGCPTCRYAKKGCHICRRPWYKPRKPRPSNV